MVEIDNSLIGKELLEMAMIFKELNKKGI